MSEQPKPASETSGALGRGWFVFIGLAILTVVEYLLAITIDANLPIMIVLAVAKAAIIIHYFMHVARLWLGHEEDS